MKKIKKISLYFFIFLIVLLLAACKNKTITKYKVTYDLDGGKWLNSALTLDESYDINAHIIEREKPEKDGFTFSHWVLVIVDAKGKKTEEQIFDLSNFQVTSDLTLKAIYK